MSERPKLTSGIVIGVVLIALGVLFLIGQFQRVEFWSAVWPFYIIRFGAAFFVGIFASGRKAVGLAIPGSRVAEYLVEPCEWQQPGRRL
ncbi:MAG: hypothetical protein ABIQ99_12240 [Thermoflexales bacterium]